LLARAISERGSAQTRSAFDGRPLKQSFRAGHAPVRSTPLRRRRTAENHHVVRIAGRMRQCCRATIAKAAIKSSWPALEAFSSRRTNSPEHSADEFMLTITNPDALAKPAPS